ncbi:MAG: Flavobacterium phage [Bacteroidota bacterium]|jgi:hypothetical protein
MGQLAIAPLQSFELIRDRIGLILADEFADQSITPLIYKERMVPFDKTDLEAINISLDMADYQDKSALHYVGNYTFHIDVYASSKTTSQGAADTASKLKMQKIIGIAMYILRATPYINLLFPPPFIVKTMITRVQIADNNNNQDAITVSMGRIVFEVHANESNAFVQGLNLVSSITNVKLHETDKGFIYINTQST